MSVRPARQSAAVPLHDFAVEEYALRAGAEERNSHGS
jgi:hypothetical protein